MGAGVLEAFTKKNPGTIAFDAVRQEEVFVIPRLLVLLGDNPMSAEFVSMMPSGKDKSYCRKCDISGKVHDVDSLLRYVENGGTAFRSWEGTESVVKATINQHPNGQR